MLRKVAREPILCRLLARSGAAERPFASAAEGSKGGTEFWSEHQIGDLPDSSVDLELLRRHNTSYPYLENHVVVGKVIGVDRDHVTISTGECLLTNCM